MTEMEALEAELKTLIENKQVEEIDASLTNSDKYVTSSVISCYQFGHQHGIAGADMRIISRGLPETHDQFDDEDNNDTSPNGRGVTRNGYAFDSVIDRLARTPN